MVFSGNGKPVFMEKPLSRDERLGRMASGIGVPDHPVYGRLSGSLRGRMDELG
jgi:hypothetical protein